MQKILFKTLLLFFILSQGNDLYAQKKDEIYLTIEHKHTDDTSYYVYQQAKSPGVYQIYRDVINGQIIKDKLKAKILFIKNTSPIWYLFLDERVINALNKSTCKLYQNNKKSWIRFTKIPEEYDFNYKIDSVIINYNNHKTPTKMVIFYTDGDKIIYTLKKLKNKFELKIELKELNNDFLKYVNRVEFFRVQKINYEIL